TLFYGVFSAWVLWSKKHPATDRRARFNWHESAWSLRVPMIRALFEQVATPSKLGPLGLAEVLDWTGAVLNRVDRETFFERFSESHAVQYFYEPFLEAFDPMLRKELGVWYTPIEVVRYMVARVDTVLREELGIPDGLADSRGYVLDPCCGTGAYLVEVVRRIHQTLTEGGGDALTGDDLKQAAMERVFGFEILPAPFVVAHLQLGLLLQNLGAPLADERNERVGVYLTNALTGWEPPKEPKARLLFPEMELERDAADRVKRETPILVILGNPPYNGFAGLAVAEERDLSDAYRTTKRAVAPQGQGLNDLYVRFFRMAERRIVERTGQGVVCYISNYSWLDGLSYSGMRERYIEMFDRICIDCLNGDKYRTGKLTPEGQSDPSIFSTEWNREGIRTGTAIALMVRRKESSGTNVIHFRHFWGVDKRKSLLESLVPVAGRPDYAEQTPPLELGLPFTPTKSNADYFTWPTVPQLFPTYYPGVQTKIDELVIDIDRTELVSRMTKYFDASISDEDMKAICHHALKESAQFDYKAIRAYLVSRGFLHDYVTKHYYRPFDLRWIYWEPETNLLGRKCPDYFPQISSNNLWFSAVQRNRKDFDPPVVTSVLSSLHVIECSANLFPLREKHVGQNSLFDRETPGKDGEWRFNLSLDAVNYLKHVGCSSSNDFLFKHTISILHSPGYGRDHLDSLRQDWPRIPLPASETLLAHSAELGSRIAKLFDTEAPVRGVTSNPIRVEMKTLGTISRVVGGSLSADDLAVTVGWGHPGKGGITMPGKGRIVEREYAPDEIQAMRQGAEALGLTVDDAMRLLGTTTRDIYLNDTAYWRNVPARVWEYTIGGYQVIKKWLSYRERDLLGRALTPAEAREVRDMARRIAALNLLQPQLDANYAAAKAKPYDWQTHR